MIRPADPARAGSDEAGFGAWVDPHWEVMRRVAWRLSAAGEAEDVVQNALLAAWRHRRRFDESRGTAAAWLTAITVNEARKSHRGRRRTELLADRDAEAAEPPPPGVDLARAIDALPARQALAVHLHYYADLPIRDVAVVMGCAEGTVKSTLSAARARLRSILGEDST